MKKLTLLLIAISLAVLSQAQQRWTKSQLEVQETISNLFESLSNRDAVGLMKYCADDIVLIEYGSIWNADTLIQKAITFNTAPDFKRTNNLEFISTDVKGKVAWAMYNLHSEITRNHTLTTLHWVETVFAVKEGKAWKIKVLHSTLIKRA